MTLKHILSISFLIVTAIYATASNAQDANLRSVQAALAELGYEPGEADGFMGPNTRTAIESFQQNQRIPISGVVDEATLRAIQQIEISAAAIPTPQTKVTEPKGNATNLIATGQIDRSVDATPTPPTTVAEPNEGNWPAIVWASFGGFVVFLLMKLFSGKKSKKNITSKRHRQPETHHDDSLSHKTYETHEDSELSAQTNADSSSATSTVASWIKDGETTLIAQREIKGLVYVGPAPGAGKYEQASRSCIDPSLTVAKTERDPNGDQMSYWPDYSEISPSSRASYLDWLASGRKNTNYNVGYMFLYFYGLERRFFVDNPSDDERQVLLRETERLRDLFQAHPSVRKYLDKFIDVAQAYLADEKDREPTFDHSGYEVPLSVLTEIGARVSQGKPIGADWALSWFMCHPERHLKTSANRCRDEFLTLFSLIFEGLYPDGLEIKKPRRFLRTKYNAASSEFEIAITPTSDGEKVADVSALRKPINDMQKIADQAMADLDKYSRYLGRKPDGRGTIEAQALLPVELQSLFPSEELDALKQWLEDIIASTGRVPVTVLLEKLEGDDFGKVRKSNLTGAADALAKLGVGMAPDPRYALRSPTEKDPVILFKLPENQFALEDVSDGYRQELLKLALATFIAQADGAVPDAEKQVLHELIKNDESITPSESLRLAANLNWFLAVPPNIPLLRANLKTATEIRRREFREVMVSMANADGVIQREEINSIEKIYKILGIESSEIYTDIHNASISDAPAVVRHEISTPDGEAIPDANRPTGLNPPAKTVLDAVRIAAIQADTKRVSSVLGDIFGDAQDDDEEAEMEYENGSPLSALDTKHAAFVEELIQRLQWTENDFSLLAKRYKLLASGSLEIINEWAVERFDEALIEEYDGYEISANVASQLNAIQ